MKKDDMVKVRCPSCNRETNHKVVWHFEDKDMLSEGADIYIETHFDTLQCLGCDSPVLREYHYFSEGDGPEVTFYPKSDYRMLKLKSIKEVPSNIRAIYEEVVAAYNSELKILCAAGIRATMEGICKEKDIFGNSLEKKIDGLRAKGLINEEISLALHENRFLGNEAIHELASFEDIELKTAIGLIELLIEILYETKGKISLLSTLRESRKK